MKQTYALILLLAAIIGFSSCSSFRIEKRQHRDGWYVDFGSQHTKQQNDAGEAETVVPSGETPGAATTMVVGTEDIIGAEPVPATPVAGGNTSSPAVVASEESVTSGPDAQNNVQHSDSPAAVNAPADEQAPSAPSDTELIILVILAILLPPVAVYLKQKLSTWFWVCLICWLLGGAFLFGHFGLGYLGVLGLLAILIALLVVFDKL